MPKRDPDTDPDLNTYGYGDAQHNADTDGDANSQPDCDAKRYT